MNKSFTRGFIGLVATVAAMSSSRAFAQQEASPDADASESSLETIVVTGTRITTPGYVSASPIATLSAEDISRQQPVDVETVLRSMPQFSPGNGCQVNNGSSGTSTVDLRGLTTPRTLPLIDGKRMVPFDPNGLFDVTAVPLALLERVDVVTGGASGLGDWRNPVAASHWRVEPC